MQIYHNNTTLFFSIVCENIQKLQKCEKDTTYQAGCVLHLRLLTPPTCIYP